MGGLTCKVCNPNLENQSEFKFGEPNQLGNQNIVGYNISSFTTLNKDLEESKLNLENRLKAENKIIENETIENYSKNIFNNPYNIDIPKEIYSKIIPQYKDTSFKLPLVKLENGELYEGTYNENGERHGYGTLIIPNEYLYKGFFDRGNKSEYGCFLYKNGDYYLGGLKDNIKEGKGELFIKDQFDYVGDFQNDQMTGEGTIKDYKEGSIYTGNLINGIKEGKGEIQFSDGSVFTGDFSDNFIEGIGKFTYSDNSSYEGEFKKNKKNGQGTQKWEDGKVYTGQFLNDIKSGYGKMIWNKDQYYEGQWLNDAQHGEGTYYLDGKVLTGLFRFGKLILEQKKQNEEF